MDYCTYGYMIDNIVLIVTGTLHERNVQVPPPPRYTTSAYLWLFAYLICQL